MSWPGIHRDTMKKSSTPPSGVQTAASGQVSSHAPVAQRHGSKASVATGESPVPDRSVRHARNVTETEGAESDASSRSPATRYSFSNQKSARPSAESTDQGTDREESTACTAGPRAGRAIHRPARPSKSQQGRPSARGGQESTWPPRLTAGPPAAPATSFGSGMRRVAAKVAPSSSTTSPPATTNTRVAC